LLGALTIGNGIGLLAASAWIIASAALHPSVAVLQVAIVGVRVFGLGRGLFRYLERLVTHDVTFRLLAHLRVTFYTAIEPLAPARLLAYRSGDLLGRVTSDIAALESFYVRAVAPPLTALLVAAGMGWFMAGYHPSLAVALLGFLLLGGVGAPMLIRGVSRAPGQRVVTARAELSAVLVDGIQGLADLLALGAAGRQIERVRAAQGRLAASQWRLALIGGLQSALMLLAANLGMWTILTLAIPRALDGVALAVLTLAALACFEAVQPLPLAAQHLESHLQAARRLFELVDAPPEVIAPAHPAPPPTDFALEIQNLTFTYPNSYHGARSTPRSLHSTLHALSLTLPPGKRLAIVGPSGAGKTTLVNLLLRFWEADRGQILLGGRPLCDYSPDDLRRRMAVISQHTYLFNATLRDNLLLARPDAAQAEIEQAARQAQIQAFIAGLPQGYDTWVGEHGLRLSGGERQRLAIARALLKDAPLLILDEPTANLDPLTERGVLEAIHTLMQGRSTFWITHRLAGMDRMDEIVVLDRGRVIERGQHRDLLAQGGLYHRMWEIQQGWLWDT
jgi:thiol reductant ABC exporter CydC subunit